MMEKLEALETIKKCWDDNTLSLADKIINISSCFYSAGLDLESTAAYIKSTPAELDFLLAMGEYDDDIIQLISDADPPKTTWPLFASASDEEIKHAISSIQSMNRKSPSIKNTPFSEIVYQQMLEFSGPTPEQKLQSVSGFAIGNALKKGKDYKALSDWEIKFLTSISMQKKRGKTLSTKQLDQLRRILTALAERNIISRNSIDGDQNYCDEILDALGKE